MIWTECFPSGLIDPSSVLGSTDKLSSGTSLSGSSGIATLQSTMLPKYENMLFVKRVSFLLLFLGAWGNPVIPGLTDPRIDVKIKYYDIQGKTAQEAQRQMRLKTPIRNDGRAFDANTTWYVKWDTQWAMKGMTCGIISVTTRVGIVFTLPKWTDYKKADHKEQEKWDRIFKQLVEHENGHKDIAVGSAKEIEREVMRMESRKDCVTLKHDSNRLGQTIIEKYGQLARDYDAATDHGRNQRAYDTWKESTPGTNAK